MRNDDLLICRPWKSRLGCRRMVCSSRASTDMSQPRLLDRDRAFSKAPNISACADVSRGALL